MEKTHSSPDRFAFVPRTALITVSWLLDWVNFSNTPRPGKSELVAVPLYYSLANGRIDIFITMRAPKGDRASPNSPLQWGHFCHKNYFKGMTRSNA